MAEQALAPEVTIWTDAIAAPTVSALLDVMGSAVRPISVGGPRVTEVDRLARSLGTQRLDDLRKLLVDHPAAYLLLATMHNVTAEELTTALGQGTTVLALEPVAADLQELDALAPRRGKPGVPAASGRIIHAPAFRQSPGFLSAAEPYDVLGTPRLIGVQSLGAAGTGSLFARLFDAWHTVLGFAELPESIDASLVGPAGAPPDELRAVSGRIGAHARMTDGSAAVLQVADQGGQTRRSLDVLGETGQLAVSDAGYDLRHADGTPVDHAERRVTVSHADLIATQWRRLLDRPTPSTPEASPDVDANALACCLACLLSARTAQPENPRKLLQMSR